MTRPRRGGTESPFSAWLRRQPGLDSVRHRLNATDADYLFHRYMTDVDRIGTRAVQLAMVVEVKCLGAYPTPAQEELLFYHHQLLATGGRTVKARRIGRPPVSLWHFGVFFLRMPGLSPDDGRFIYWGRFDCSGQIRWVKGSVPGLVRLLRFEIRPDNFQRLQLRRHHCTRSVSVVEPTPLGFSVERIVTRRS